MELRLVALGVAIGHLADGVGEEGGDNRGPMVRRYLENAGIRIPAAWCAAAVQYWTDAGARILGASNPLDLVGREALVADYVQAAESEVGGIRIVLPSEVLPGDLVAYRFGRSTRWNHLGIVFDPPEESRSELGYRWTHRAIEGNTHAGVGETDEEREREGDGVFLRTRPTTETSTLFLRWDGSTSSERFL